MIIPLEHWKDHGIDVTSESGSTDDPIAHVLDNSLERVALDLHVGDDYQVDFDGWVAIGDGFILHPNECVRIRVDENITAPVSVFGQVCSKTAKSADGLLIANLKIDPNFAGQLEPTVFNAGKAPVRITKNLIFASVWFGTLNPVPDDPPRRGPEVTRGSELVHQGLPERWYAARPYVLTGLTTIIAALVLRII